MSNKKEINLNIKHIQSVILIFLIPLILTFLLQHLGEFNATAQGTNEDPNATVARLGEGRLATRTFHTFFGSEITDNLWSQNLPAVREKSNGTITPIPLYNVQLAYFARALLIDILYPLTLSVIILFIYLFKSKFKVNITN